MDGSAMFRGRFHWNDEKLYEVTKAFIQLEFGL